MDKQAKIQNEIPIEFLFDLAKKYDVTHMEFGQIKFDRVIIEDKVQLEEEVGYVDQTEKVMEWDPTISKLDRDPEA